MSAVGMTAIRSIPMRRPARLPATAFALGALLAVYASWQTLRWGPGADRHLIGDAFFYPVSGAATATAWSAARRCAGWPRLQRAWRLLAAAAFAYLLGDVAQTVYELIGRKPYPSAADGLYLVFYPLMLAGLLSFPVARRAPMERVRLALDLAIVALGGSTVVVYVVLGPTAIAGGDPFQAAISVAYPVGDMVILVGLASVLLRGSATSARRALQLLALGIGLYVAADLVYGWITLHSSYSGGDPVDTLWMLAIAATAIAAGAQGDARAPEEAALARTRVSVLPYAAVATGFAVLLASDWHDEFFPGLAMPILAVLLVALVVVRQLLAQRDLAQAQGELRHLALHDALTGLPNRTLILDRAEQMLARARRNQTSVAVLFVDLDDFKQVNDTFGHAAGDKLLRVVAARLSTVVRESDTVARLGGDEFMILLDGGSLIATPELVAERVLAVLREPIDLNGSTGRILTTTASIGIAVGLRSSADELVRDADMALYRAKAVGKDRYAVYESEMHAAAESRLNLQLDIHDAIEGRQFYLVYQPTFDLHTESVSGFEALIRWRHPDRGVVGPDLLIPVAEETGTIVAIGRWVLEEACRQAAEWRRAGSDVGMAVNVSGRQLDADGFVDDVRNALAASGLDPSALTLEITETTLMREPVAAAQRLVELKALGVRVAIDDFGTGYSSLAYLRQFPVDAIKIDRSFISGVAATKESAALIHTLVQVGKALGLETLGEGIEEPAQLRRLQRENCDLGQGYLLARPLEVEAAEVFLAESRTLENLPAA